jgi:integrase/recombinase XerD
MKGHVHPHTLRHYAVTCWILDGLREQDINYRAGWTKDSKQMFSTYGNFADDDMNMRIFEHYGLKTDDRRQIVLKKCPRCNNVLKPEDRFCSQCSLVLSNDAFQEVQEQKNDLIQTLRYAMEDPEFQMKLIAISEEKKKELRL